MLLICSYNPCSARTDLPGLPDSDEARRTLGYHQIVAEAVVVTAPVGESLSLPVSALVGGIFAAKRWRVVFTDDCRRGWILGAGRADLPAWRRYADELGATLSIDSPPMAGHWVCSKAHEAAVVANVRPSEAPTFYGDTPATRALLAERARHQVDPQRNPANKYDCSSCSAHLQVPAGADHARWLTTSGWCSRDTRKFCSARCRMLAGTPAVGPLAPIDTEAFRAALAREKQVHAAPALRSDATQSPRGKTR